MGGAGAASGDERDAVARVLRGRAVQVDPIKPTLKAPGSKKLILKHDQLVSNLGFDFNLRRFNVASLLADGTRLARPASLLQVWQQPRRHRTRLFRFASGDVGDGVHASVRRCRLTLSNLS